MFLSYIHGGTFKRTILYLQSLLPGVCFMIHQCLITYKAQDTRTNTRLSKHCRDFNKQNKAYRQYVYQDT